MAAEWLSLICLAVTLAAGLVMLHAKRKELCWSMALIYAISFWAFLGYGAAWYFETSHRVNHELRQR